MVLSPTMVAAILHTDKRWATLAFAQGIAKASISLSFITLMMQLMVGVPKLIGILSAKLDKSRITRGYLVFIIALDSIYLNPDNNVAQRLSVGITQTHAGNFCTYEVSNWPHSNEWLLTYLGVIVLICTNILSFP